MTLDVFIREFLLAEMAIVAMVEQRIYHQVLPQKVVLPAIRFQQLSDLRDPHLRGPDGIARARYQFDAFAQWPKDAKTLAGLIRQRLDAFQGHWTDLSSPADSLAVQGVFFETAIDLFNQDIHGGTAQSSADYWITHRTLAGVV